MNLLLGTIEYRQVISGRIKVTGTGRPSTNSTIFRSSSPGRRCGGGIVAAADAAATRTGWITSKNQTTKSAN